MSYQTAKDIILHRTPIVDFVLITLEMVAIVSLGLLIHSL